MKSFKQLSEELSPNAIKKPEIDSGDRKQKYILGPNGKPKKISVPAHEIVFNKQNEEIELHEKIVTSDYKVTSEPSKFGGHRPKVVNKENNKEMYLSQYSYKNPEDAEEHAKTYLNAYAAIGMHHADKKVNDFVKSNKDKLYQKEEVELDESNPFKHIDDVIRKVRNKAAVAALKSDKPAEEKYSKRLNKVMSYRNKMLATESVESDKQMLDNHVTNSEPSLSNINKMHDMVRNISKTHGISTDKLYNQVKNNSAAHEKFRDASTD